MRRHTRDPDAPPPSAAQRRCEHIEGNYERALCALSVNLLRVIAGAGEPFEIGSQIEELYLAQAAYVMAGGRAPDAAAALALTCEADEDPFAHSLPSLIEQAALRRVAADLSGARAMMCNTSSKFNSLLLDYANARGRGRR